MIISEKSWSAYLDRLRRVNDKAASLISQYIQQHDITTKDGHAALLEYVEAVVGKYSEGAAEAACQMYDAIADASGKVLPAAEPAPTPTFGDVAKTLNGTMKHVTDPDGIGASCARLVKRTGVDTTMRNALRDGAEWAWIPHGDTCGFCLMLASNGWQKASKKALKGGHAEHIHANCDCTYAIRFDSRDNVAGYDPDALYEQYMNAGDNRDERLRNMQREYQSDRSIIVGKNGIDTVKTKEKWIGSLAADEAKKLAPIIKRSVEPMQHGFSCFGDSPEDRLMQIGASRIESKGDFFDVAMHGSPNAVCFGGKEPNMTPRMLASIIKHHPDYHGENIRLFCCKTGQTKFLEEWEYCFAEELSNILGVVVEAPDDLVYIDNIGGWGVGYRKKKELIPFKPNQRGRYK